MLDGRKPSHHDSRPIAHTALTDPQKRNWTCHRGYRGGGEVGSLAAKQTRFQSQPCDLSKWGHRPAHLSVPQFLPLGRKGDSAGRTPVPHLMSHAGLSAFCHCSQSFCEWPVLPVFQGDQRGLQAQASNTIATRSELRRQTMSTTALRRGQSAVQKEGPKVSPRPLRAGRTDTGGRNTVFSNQGTLPWPHLCKESLSDVP